MMGRCFHILGYLTFLVVMSGRGLSAEEAIRPLPDIDSYVVDQTETLGDLQEKELSEILERIEKENGSQVVLVIVSTTKPETIEQYSIRLAEKTGIGRKETDDGVLVLLAKEDRRVRIEVGYGLEGAIPDARAHRIIDTIIIPQFKKGEFYVGLRNGILALEKLIKKEPLPEAKPVARTPEIPAWEYFFYDGWFYWSWITYGIAALLGWYAAKSKRYNWMLIWALLAGMHPPALWLFAEGYFAVHAYIPRLIITLLAFHIPYWLAGGGPVGRRRSGSSGGSRSWSSSSGSSFRSFSGSSFSSRSSSSSFSSGSSSSFSGGGGSFGGGG
ncbi:MAG: TPM domain-containing protein, partial [Leptospiraceae bacterium]|nr:TPM domain-containing protein [Leptospiraceae bacterium]